MPMSVYVPDNCRGDIDLDILGIPLAVKIRTLELDEKQPGLFSPVAVFHVTLQPMISVAEYQAYCDNAEAITKELVIQIDALRTDVGQFAIINIVDWFEFIQY